MTPILGGMSISHMDACMHKEHMSCEHFIGSKIRKREELVNWEILWELVKDKSKVRPSL